ncbi:hypothetical protein ACIHDR_46020 [Nocardia sp. NPDC052278]|uniref:hypothetical protein n=1 Tax=unclassified Nocardia TaxID=2637762 RepID=UPI0036B56F1C
MVLTSRRIIVLIAVAVAMILGCAPSAVAQPSTTANPDSGTSDSGTSSTYGFDQLCNEIHDGLSQIPVIGEGLGDAGSAACKAGNAASHPGSAIEATKSKLWESTFGKVTEILLSGLGDALTLSMSWVLVPNDRILTTPGNSTDPEQTLWGRIDSYTRQLQTWLLAISIAVSALRIGIARAHMAAEHAEEAFKMLARSTMTTWVAGAAILAGARMTDSVSVWIINDATSGNATGAAELLVRTDRFGVFGPGVVFLVAIVGILGALAMTALTIIRQALLVVAVGIYPLTAAASGTAGGKQSYQKLGAWIIAFLLFKPTASLVYMIAFTTADQTNSDVEQSQAGAVDSAHRALVGIVLLCSVAFVLPALIRLVTPALSAVGSGGGGAGATGFAIGAAAALATGGKALLARGAVSGGAGSAGFVSNTGTGSTPPKPPNGGGSSGGAKSLPPGPSSGPQGSGGGAPRLNASPQGTHGPVRTAIRAAGAGMGTGNRVNRVGNDVSGGNSEPPPRAELTRGTQLGRHGISK